MGAANKRGNKEQRVALAVEKRRLQLEHWREEDRLRRLEDEKNNQGRKGISKLGMVMLMAGAVSGGSIYDDVLNKLDNPPPYRRRSGGFF